MPYTLRFIGKATIGHGTLIDYFRGRYGYQVAGTKVVYENPDTSITFSFELETDGVTLSIDHPRAPVFGLEAELEASALVAQFGFEVPDPDTASSDSKTLTPYSSETLLRGYARANTLAHEALLEEGSEYHELPSGVLSRVWRWNFQRAALERLHGSQTFIPRVIFVSHPEHGQLCTAAIWPASMPALLPQVEVLILTDHGERTLWVATRDVEQLLDSVGLRSPRFRYRLDGHLVEAGLAHHDVSTNLEVGPAIVDAARSNGDLPATIPMAGVLSRELTRVAMGIADVAREKKTEKASPFPRECEGFNRTRLFDLSHALGGYTWLSPWRIEAIAHSEGGAVLAGVGAGGVVFFDAHSGKRIREVRGDAHAGTSIGISRDGKTLAVGDELGNVNVFDIDLAGRGPTLMKRASHSVAEDVVDGSAPHGYVIGLSVDGSVVLGGAGDNVFVLRDGKEPEVFAARGAVCASRDLSWVWTGAALRDLETGEESFRLGVAIDPRTIRVPALSPDGRHLAFATSSGALQLVRLEDGAVLAAVQRKNERGEPVVARFIAFMPSGAKLVVGDSTGLEVRSAVTLEREKVFETPVWDAELSETMIYRAAEDRVWTQPLEGPAPPVNDGPITQLFHSTRGPIAIASSAPGDGMTGGRAIMWHLPSGEVLRATDRLCPDRINLSPNGRLLCLATESALRVLDVGTLKEVSVVEPLGDERFVRPLDLDASPDGEHVLVCLDGGLVRMISIGTGADRWREHLGVRCATFTPGGRQIIAGDASRLRVVNAVTGTVEKEIAIDDVREDGEHVLLGEGRAARAVPGEGVAIIDLEVGTSETQPLPRAREVLAAAPDGSLIAISVDNDDGREDLVLWSMEAREEVDRIRLDSAADAPISAAFAPDGSKLLVGTSRGALLVFAKR